MSPSRRPSWLPLALLLGLIAPTDAAINVFIFGDYVLDHPWGTFGLTCVVIGLSIILELLMHGIHHKITNQYSQLIIEHVLNELQMLGIISLCLVFAINFLPQDSNAALGLILLFDWAHMVLFVFAMFFLTYVATLFGIIKITWRTWSRYEKEAAEIHQAKAEGKHAKEFALFPVFARFRQQVMHINPEYADIGLCRYLKKAQRKNLLFVVELNKTSWASLLVLSLFNSIRGLVLIAVEPTQYFYDANADGYHTSYDTAYCKQVAPPCNHSTAPWNLLLFIIIIGITPLVALFIISLRLRLGFRTFVKGASGGQASGGHNNAHSHDHHGHDEKAEPLLEDGVLDHHQFFFFRSPDITLQLIQICVIYIVYYLTLFVMSMIYEAFRSQVGVGVVLLLLGLIPPLLFMIELPNVLQLMTILSSTGNLLDEEMLDDIYTKDFSERQELVDRAKEENQRFQLEEEEDDHAKKRVMRDHRASIRAGGLLGADAKVDILSELALRPAPAATASPTAAPEAPSKSFAELMKERAAQLSSTTSPTSH